MKFKINAGAEIDVLNKEELQETLGSWFTEISRGVRFRQISAQGTVSGGVWTIGGNAPDNHKDPLGPSNGFLWAVTRLALAGGGVVLGTDLWNVYVNEIAPSKLVQSGLTRFAMYDVPVLILQGGDRLAAAGAGTGVAGTDVTISGQVVEIPVQLAWQLL